MKLPWERVNTREIMAQKDDVCYAFYTLRQGRYEYSIWTTTAKLFITVSISTLAKARIWAEKHAEENLKQLRGE